MNTNDVILICDNCGTKLKVKSLDNDSLTCPRCLTLIPLAAVRREIAEQVAKEEAEQRKERRTKILSYLKAMGGLHYVAFDAESRKMVEEEYQRLLADGINAWGQVEQDIHIALSEIKGRDVWLISQWQAAVLKSLVNVEKGLNSLSKTIAPLAQKLDALENVATDMNKIKNVASMGGILAAQELGKRLADGFSSDN